MFEIKNRCCQAGFTTAPFLKFWKIFDISCRYSTYSLQNVSNSMWRNCQVYMMNYGHNFEHLLQHKLSIKCFLSHERVAFSVLFLCFFLPAFSVLFLCFFLPFLAITTFSILSRVSALYTSCKFLSLVVKHPSHVADNIEFPEEDIDGF